MTVLGTLRRKYLSFLPKDRSVVDSETGEVISQLDEEGREVLDDTPLAPPVGFTEQPSMAEYIRMMVQSERLRQEAEEAGMETFEESEDFDVDDDFDPTTPYENDFDPDISELKSAVEEEKQRKKAPSQEPKKKSVDGDKPSSFIQPAEPDGSAEPDGD
nr:MAG: hypothetical protein [Microvirus sp.]